MRLKSYWRLYQSYVRSDTREEALEVMTDASSAPADYFLRLASHFARDYGRLPDELHNIVVLTGGEHAAEYLKNLSGKTEGQEV